MAIVWDCLPLIVKLGLSPSLPCPAMPCLALPCLASPGLATP